ncbi:hypothetical protein [Nocardia sp. NPDC005745]|uniref:hypothetical protein n=1 Tax=Nocardia sp. NPDC005745 TaxID=3157061 RepID=UPI0033D542BF
MTTINTGSPQQVGIGAARTPGLLVALAVASPLALWIGLLGPAWIYMPASPAAGTPPMYLSFADLATMYAQSPSALQLAYFDWMAWVFAVVGTVLALLLSWRPNSVVALSAVIAGITELALAALASKGDAPWSGMNPESIRLGAALVLFGYTALAALGIVALRAARRDPA